ncbi:hypothetical protein BS47DRAFT_1378108 [Hydnum rufescens UP504]|uniref:Inosine/uridine-preferring nucleoside hydrolase domain-containing protein n=1 Tax=Hydnum rufescens UP504 TaxID=1448309 RepID=A0A9P6AIR8_9AGAM|nr:hypothetical protein BS47DRAFT_1378108 [Hydnum rufescens UP504]
METQGHIFPPYSFLSSRFTIRTPNGRRSAVCTLRNATRLLYAFAPHLSDLIVYPGAAKPLIRPSRADPEIHGKDGLGGVVGLPTFTSPAISSRLKASEGLKAIEGIANATRKAIVAGTKIHLVACGPLTNIALFISVYPELIAGIEEICFMGGGVGIGNRSPVAEFNILCDPEAAQIVVDADVRKVMIPLNPTTPLRETLSSLLSFFAESYRTTFGFIDGPPLHDALTIAYVSKPELFETIRYRVDVDCSTSLGVGQTVVDVFNYRTCEDNWGSAGKNVLVAIDVDVAGFFDVFFASVDRCDLTTPLNMV